MNNEMFFALVGVAGSLSGIVFAYIAFRKGERAEHKVEGKSEGLILSDIGYIKACVDRMEKNLTNVDERYRGMVERLAKTEEAVQNLQRRFDEVLGRTG